MSNSLLFQLLLKMDAGQAKAELQAFTAATATAGKQVGDLPAKARPAKAAIEGMADAYETAGLASEKAAKLTTTAALATARAELLRLKSTDGATQEDIAAARAAYDKANAMDAAAAASLAAARANAQMAGTAQTMGRSHQAAAGSVGNLVAQFNDVGMMIAAGQNPLQTAIQQGTQITQVIGPMGAGGAVKALGAAFIGMLNPINLVTFGVIAGGAALAQWAMSGEEAVTSIADRIKDIEVAVTEVSDKIATIRFDEENIGVARAIEQLQLLELQLVRINARRAESLNERARYTLEYDAGVLQAEYDGLKQVVQEYREAVALKQRLEDRSTAEEMLADLQAEADLNAVIAEYGAQSAEATTLRAQQERAAYVEKVKALEVSEAMKLSLVVAFDNAQALASLDITAGIAAAANSAAVLAANLGVSLGTASKMMALGYEGKQPVVFDPRDPKFDEGAAFRERARLGHLPHQIADKVSIGGIRAGTGAGGAAQVDSVAKLVEKLQAELDVSRELDPVQREMAKYREQLARATDGERQQVEALIAQRLREKEVTESLGYIGQQSGNALIDGLMGAADAGEQLVQTLMRAALQAALLGEGPLAGLFGGGGGLLGGLFGMIGGGGIMGRADGGMIYGAGGPRDDAIPFWGSAGEFVVNAKATARNRTLLERINSGQMPSGPAFANGGAIGGVAAAGGTFGGMVLNAHFDLRGAQGDDAVEAAARRGMEQALKEFARTEMAGHVRRMTADPSVMRF